MRIINFIIIGIILSSFASNAQTFKPAERVFKRTTDYVKDAFGGVEPDKETLWVIGSLRDNINEVMENMGSTPVRYRYWKQGNKTVWIVESIARTMPITAGVTVNDGAIEDISVLTYRETRGHEVQNRVHRAQYYGAKLTENNSLDKSIDGISGSTLSVNSMKRMARIALLLHAEVTSND